MALDTLPPRLLLQGDLRIAHCGGYHSDFDTLIKAINVIAKLLHLDIRWVWCETAWAQSGSQVAKFDRMARGCLALLLEVSPNV